MTAEPRVGAAARGVARVLPPPAPRVRAIAHVDDPAVRAAVPARARGAASAPWSPVVGNPHRAHGSGPAQGVAAVPDPSPDWRVRASVPPVVVARRTVAPGPTLILDRAAIGAPAGGPDVVMGPVYVAGPGVTSPAPDAVPPTGSAPDAVPPTGSAPARVPRRRPVLRRALLPVSIAAAAAFVAATGYLAVTEPRSDTGMGRWSTIGAAPAPQTLPLWNPLSTAENEPFGAATPQPQGPPTRLRVTAIGVDTALESLHLGKDGQLTPPQDFARAGWYADGTTPGDQGPAVIAGHVDSKRGPAVFYRLRELEAGDQIEVVRGGRTVRFTVISAAWYPKTGFPSEQVYGPTPDRELRLITCGGVFDDRLRSYRDNLVVYAVAG